MSFASDDHRHISSALSLARRGLGETWPNPSVGCVIVKDGTVVGRGRTQPGGRPHAEVMALKMAGEHAYGATAYVTLEPCSHYGKTPPCCDALIAAGVARVVMSMEDTDPRVSGRGRKRLEEAGISVTSGVEHVAARQLNAGFFSKVERNRPLITLKLATSLDARSALMNGASQWITGPEARAYGHYLRAHHDGILIGSGTAAADDPTLTCRLTGLETRSPVRIVLDRTLRLSPSLQLFTDQGPATWIVTTPELMSSAQQRFSHPDLDVISVNESKGQLKVDELMQRLAERGMTRILVESGGALASSLIRHNLVDQIAWFTAPSLIGGDGRAAMAALGLENLQDQPRFSLVEERCLGSDRYQLLQLAPQNH